MKTIFLILLVIFGSLPYSIAAPALTESQAIEKVKELPEFIEYSKAHKYAFDDNELIKGQKDDPIWRIDVRTIVSTPKRPT